MTTSSDDSTDGRTTATYPLRLRLEVLTGTGDPCAHVFVLQLNGAKRPALRVAVNLKEHTCSWAELDRPRQRNIATRIPLFCFVLFSAVIFSSQSRAFKIVD